jgi:hypothetical protein
VVVLATAVLLLWWSGIPHPLRNAPLRPSAGALREALARGIGYGRLIGLLLAPILVWAGPVRTARRAWAAGRALTVVVGGLAATALAVGYSALAEDAFVGNYVHPRGVLGDDVLAGFRPDLMPTPLWILVVLVGSLGGLALALTAVPWLAGIPARVRARNLDSVDPIALLFGVTLGGLWCAYLLTDTLQLNHFPIFDRYALGGLPLVAALVLRAAGHDDTAPTAARRVTTAITLGLLALLGLTFTIDSANYDATRWRVGRAAVEAGYSPRNVDGGFEWNNWFAGSAPRWGETKEEHSELLKRRHRGQCVSVVVNPSRLPASDRVVARLRYDSPLRSPVWVVARRNGRRCTQQVIGR